MAKIGFVGLGNMGGPMAANLLKAGHELKVFDIVPELVKKSGEQGASAVGDVSEVVKDVDVFI